jgi:hypothetical protein
MWVVGTLRYGEFTPLPDLPPFQEAWQAREWAIALLADNPGTLASGVDCLTWRFARKSTMWCHGDEGARLSCCLLAGALMTKPSSASRSFLCSTFEALCI